MGTKPICLPSFAKVNIGLFVKGKRADGFHEIETILQQIDLKDTITVSLDGHQNLALVCNNPEIPTDDTNLCIRAAKIFMERTGLNAGVTMELDKVIPVGAGLGGGSSNAAVVLMALNCLFDDPLSGAELVELSALLGSDVPFFIQGGTALATGRGEKLIQLDRSFTDRPLLVVYPGVGVSTPWAYSNLNLNLTINRKDRTLASFKDRNFNELEFLKLAQNDFEEVVFDRFSRFSAIKMALRTAGAVYVSLSGSGSALFGLFESDEGVVKAQAALSNDCQTFPAHFTHWGISQVGLKNHWVV